MSAMHLFAARRSLRGAVAPSRDHDGLACCDVAPPDHRAHRRGFLLLLTVVAAIAAVAVVAGMVHGLFDMFGAFSRPSALFEAGSWDRFFAGFGQLAALGLIAAAAVLAIRWRLRRKRAATKPK